MIRFDRVYKRYPGSDALSELSFEIEAGEMVYLTGHSGAGKSTVLRLAGALERPSRGSVLVDGINAGKLSSRRIPRLRRKIGMVFQDHRLLADRTIFDNVALPLVIAGLPRRDLGRRVRAALDLVGLRDREKAFPAALSSGEQQRVGIARAFVGRPPVLLADEPTGNLDPELSRDIMRLFAKLNEAGLSLLIASHDLPLVRAMGKRVLVLQEGRLIDDFRPDGRSERQSA
ncbi:MAG: cell division ATP-binding protein FtsE [Xanthomonadales bacterium]|nr:cell division ATP-binding protein FtsE [Xanthomonadales bacterium]